MNRKITMRDIEEATTHTSCDYGLSSKDASLWRDKLIKIANRRPLCVVENWTYWDIKFSDEDVATLKERGYLPAAIYAVNIIWDEQNRWPRGYCVKTTLLQYFEHNCLFHTKNTSYLLAGPGSRCTISPVMFNGIHF